MTGAAAVTAGSTSKSTQPTAVSPWGSEESRDFLQERLSRFARIVFLVSFPLFIASWVVNLIWYPTVLEHGLPLGVGGLFNLGWVCVLLAMWLATRNGPLPGTVLHAVDAGGVFLVSMAMIGMSFSLGAVVMRPDLLAVVAILGLLLYRAAIVPSEPSRTAWIGVACSAPLPFVTYSSFAKAARPPGLPPASAYMVWVSMFAVLIVLLSSKISSVIYGLRQTVREARRLGPYTLVSKIGEGGWEPSIGRSTRSCGARPRSRSSLPNARGRWISRASSARCR